MNFATWNVRGVNEKEVELMQELKQHKIHLAVITETKKKLKGTKDWGEFIEIWSGVDQNRRASAGVMVLVDQRWKNRIESYSFVSERIIRVRFKMDRGYLTLFGTYAPEEGKKEATIEFYEELQKQLTACNKADYVIVAGDLNARVGNQPIPQVVGTFGEYHLNENGRQLRDFCTYNELKITNTFFRKKTYTNIPGQGEDTDL
ncbi:craniofacial development protein 2-like [Nilaparvata lugens]|uniref:craniofacial development protein 2-like n=1 Tax=Nilaparvata lugens TaxID=108931 RepID=UPI000B98CB20|nr:craniofacial development protein 2-like [Nilaparvata lugens]